MIASGNVVRGQTGHGILGKLSGHSGSTTKFGVSLCRGMISSLRILILDVYRVRVADPVITSRELEDSPDGLVCDLHTDPHPDWTLFSSAPFCILRASRSARGSRSFVG
jgi:hypothetical protein